MTRPTSTSDQAILKLLAGARKNPPVESDPVEASDYDWNVPSRFTSLQMDVLEGLASKIAMQIGIELGSQLHEEVQLSQTRPKQHYAGRLVAEQVLAEDFHFSIMTRDARQCGIATIPGNTARLWVGKALGGSATASDNNHELSVLELALLRDIVVAIAEVFSSKYRTLGGEPIQCGPQVDAAEALGEIKSDDEYCVLSFRAESDDSDRPVVSFVLSSDLLSDVAGGSMSSPPTDEAPVDSREKLLACINQASVTATVSILTTNLSLRDVMELEVGDVLLADKCVGQPLDLLVGGAVVMSGHPVSCDRQYALQIID